MKHKDKVLKVLFEENYAEVNRIVRGTIGNSTPYAGEEELEDCAQYVLMMIFEKAEKLNNPQHWKSWVYQLARNYSINYVISQERRALAHTTQINESDSVIDGVPLDSYDEVDRILRSTRFRHPKGLEIARMVLLGFTNQEISDNLKMSMRRVAEIVRDVKQTLKETLVD